MHGPRTMHTELEILVAVSIRLIEAVCKHQILVFLQLDHVQTSEKAEQGSTTNKRDGILSQGHTMYIFTYFALICQVSTGMWMQCKILENGHEGLSKTPVLCKSVVS
jgi:hypothetical protein